MAAEGTCNADVHQASSAMRCKNSAVSHSETPTTAVRAEFVQCTNIALSVLRSHQSRAMSGDPRAHAREY